MSRVSSAAGAYNCATCLLSSSSIPHFHKTSKMGKIRAWVKKHLLFQIGSTEVLWRTPPIPSIFTTSHHTDFIEHTRVSILPTPCRNPQHDSHHGFWRACPSHGHCAQPRRLGMKRCYLPPKVTGGTVIYAILLGV